MASFNITNAPQFPDMIKLKSISDNMGGPAKACKYAVVIAAPKGMLYNSANDTTSNYSVVNELTYLCEAAEFPGRGFENLELRYYGPVFKIPHRSEYETINMTFICRNESREREFFDDWMELINPTTTYNFNFRDDYMTYVRLYHYSEIGAPTYTFTLFEAFPILVNPQAVAWSDENFIRLTVGFTYTKWRREYKDDKLFTNVSK